MVRVTDAYWKIRAIELKQEENLLGPIVYTLYCDINRTKWQKNSNYNAARSHLKSRKMATTRNDESKRKQMQTHHVLTSRSTSSIELNDTVIPQTKQVE